MKRISLILSAMFLWTFVLTGIISQDNAYAGAYSTGLQPVRGYEIVDSGDTSGLQPVRHKIAEIGPGDTSGLQPVRGYEIVDSGDTSGLQPVGKYEYGAVIPHPTAGHEVSLSFGGQEFILRPDGQFYDSAGNPTGFYLSGNNLIDKSGKVYGSFSYRKMGDFWELVYTDAKTGKTTVADSLPTSNIL